MSAATSKRNRPAPTTGQRVESPPSGGGQSDVIATSAAAANAQQPHTQSPLPPGESEPFTSPDFEQGKLCRRRMKATYNCIIFI